MCPKIQWNDIDWKKVTQQAVPKVPILNFLHLNFQYKRLIELLFHGFFSFGTACQSINRLQTRITKAVLEGKWQLVKRLQYLLTHSFYAKLLAVNKICQNKGKRTAGIDGEKWLTSKAKMNAVLNLSDESYKAKPVKRVSIEKPGKKKKRPLGIPTMHDRAMQALYALALDPVSEATADIASFGFRKYRSTQKCM